MITETNKTEANKALYREFIEEIFNHGRLEKLNDFLSPSYQLRDSAPGTPAGPQSVAGIVKLFRSAFPDINISIEEQIAEGDLVSSLTTTSGTHRGPVFGVQPTNRRINVPGLTMVRVVDGRIMESWVKNDTVALLKQLGASALPK